MASCAIIFLASFWIIESCPFSLSLSLFTLHCYHRLSVWGVLCIVSSMIVVVCWFPHFFALHCLLSVMLTAISFCEFTAGRMLVSTYRVQHFSVNRWLQCTLINACFIVFLIIILYIVVNRIYIRIKYLEVTLLHLFLNSLSYYNKVNIYIYILP
jgi:hypothetical protein